MKLVLISAIAASAFVALSASATFAQSKTSEKPVQAVAQDANGPITVPHNAAAAVDTPSAIRAASDIRTKPYESLISSHAASNRIPPDIIHSVIARESRYRADAVGRGGASGLMQIKLATARAMGYSGTAAGLLDPDTNLTWGVKYLAGAYRAAGGQHGRALGYYASGYHHAARQRHAVNAYAKAPVSRGRASRGPVGGYDG